MDEHKLVIFPLYFAFQSVAFAGHIPLTHEDQMDLFLPSSKLLLKITATKFLYGSSMTVTKYFLNGPVPDIACPAQE
jgi:hypothetical protein